MLIICCALFNYIVIFFDFVKSHREIKFEMIFIFIGSHGYNIVEIKTKIISSHHSLNFIRGLNCKKQN